MNFVFTIKLKSLTLRRSTEKTQMNISICLRISAQSVHTIGRFAKWRSKENFEDIPVHNYKATPAWTAILDVTLRETLVVFQNKLKRCDMLRNTYNFSSNNDFGFNSFIFLWSYPNIFRISCAISNLTSQKNQIMILMACCSIAFNTSRENKFQSKTNQKKLKYLAAIYWILSKTEFLESVKA